MSTTAGARQQKYTDQQDKAVTTRDVSVSLSAGAGCGKTFVLTERYLSHLNPHDPDALGPEQIGQLVAITFTERAAREMRDRIRRRCYERLQSASDVDADYWGRLLRALDNARISTIHAFCASLLRSRAVEAGLDPQFGVLEQAQADTLLSEAVDDEIRRLIGLRDETTLELAVQFGIKGLRSMVRDLVLQATPQLLERWRDVTAAELVELWRVYFEEIKPKLAADLAESPAAKEVLELLEQHVPEHPTMAERRVELFAALDALASFGAKDSLSELLDRILENSRVKGGGGAKAWVDKATYESVRDAAKKLREAAEKLLDFADYTPTAALPAAELGVNLLGLSDRVYAAYDVRKRELRVLDFSDLLVRARALLTAGGRSSVARELGEKITLLLVDEFQDTDPTQVELVEALCGEGLATGKLFFVGDHKQSIYRFRGAKPHVFARLRERTPETGQQVLSLNFRSQPAILDFVNALFWDDLGDKYEPLRPHREQVSKEPAIEFLWAPNSSGDKETADETRNREAKWIARRLRAILDSGEPIVWDETVSEGQPPVARPARNGDIAILFRALTNVEAYEAALRDHEIDYYLVGGHAFYAQQEIYDLLNLLRSLNSSADVVSLVGALRSPFFSLTDETIFWLAQHPKGISGGLFAGPLPKELSSGERQRAAFAAETIRYLRSCKDRLRISELIEAALSRTGYDAILLNEFLGERKLANLLKLQEQARTFQRGDFLGLSDFIAQLAEFVVRQPDEPLAATHSEETNVVRLMSIHQSKGLEFPIVVVPDLNRSPHGGADRVSLDEQLGPLARLPGGGDDAGAVTGYDLWRYREKIEEAAEVNRLLYVATTRAADYLMLSAGVDAVGDDRAPWMKLLVSRFDLQTGRFVGKLPAGNKLPKIKVTIDEPPKPKRRGSSGRKAKVSELVERMSQVPASVIPLRPEVDVVPADSAARRQYSFSRLAGTLHRKYERQNEEDAAGGTDTPDPRGLGTLVHAVLAVMDFKHSQNVRSLVERFAEQHLPDAPQQITEAIEMIERFANSPRARQIAQAKISHAETEFLLGWPGSQAATPISLRGYIDRFYQDELGQWHVLDFKTNVVGPSGVASLAPSYEMQMLVYGLATQRILKAPPASLVLHFLRTGEEFSYAWDDAAERRVVQLVDAGIAAAQARPQLQRP